MSNTTFDVPDAAPDVHVMDVGLTRPPLALHLPVPLPDPSTALVQLAANGALLAMSLPDVTVTTGFPVVPVEQLSWALIDMTVEAGVPALSRGLNLTFPVAWHCNVPVALNRGVALASAPISNDAMRVSAVTVGRINAKCFLRTSCLRGPRYQDGGVCGHLERCEARTRIPPSSWQTLPPRRGRYSGRSGGAPASPPGRTIDDSRSLEESE
jgi:hypothetical protein